MNGHRWMIVVAGWLFALAFAPAIWAEEPAEANEEKPAAAAAEKPGDKKPDAKAEEKPADSKEGEKPDEGMAKAAAGPTGPITIKRGPFKVEAVLEGAAESPQASELSITPREWADFTIVKVVEHGQRVKAGDVLLEFDAHKLDAEIAELEAGRDLARRTVELAEHEVKLFGDTGPLDLQMAQRAEKEAQEDLDYFVKIGRGASDKSSQFMEKYSAVNLEGAEEELKQLEKMYKADDLTDATEEIILKRARHDVEFAKQRLELVQIERKELLDYELPRAEKTLTQAAQAKELAKRRVELMLPGEFQQKRINLAKAQFELKQGDDKLARLKEDRQLMVVEAPTAGIVYHGKSDRGRWNVAAADGLLRRGAPVAAHETLLTLVPPGEMRVAAVVPGRYWSWLKKDAAGTVAPSGRSETRLGAKLTELGAAPGADGAFTARVSLDDPLTPLLTPGLGCTVRFRLYSKADAISIPLKALQDDELDDEKHFVYVTYDDDTHERRNVTIGRMSDERVEILSGLEEGDRILTEKPDDE